LSHAHDDVPAVGSDKFDHQLTVHVEKHRRAIAVRDERASGRVGAHRVATAHHLLLRDLELLPLPRNGHVQREWVEERGLRFGRRGQERGERGQS
jgi:hypothetical protein